MWTFFDITFDQTGRDTLWENHCYVPYNHVWARLFVSSKLCEIRLFSCYTFVLIVVGSSKQLNIILGRYHQNNDDPIPSTKWLRYLLLLISMLCHRQAIFESKGDKLSSSAECRIRTWKSQDTYSPADWMSTHKPTELSRIKLKNLNSTARPYDEWPFSPLDFTAVGLSHLALAIYMFVVNFDALAQASDIRQQPECPLTNRLSYRGSS